MVVSSRGDGERARTRGATREGPNERGAMPLLVHGCEAAVRGEGSVNDGSDHGRRRRCD